VYVLRGLIVLAFTAALAARCFFYLLLAHLALLLLAIVRTGTGAGCAQTEPWAATRAGTATRARRACSAPLTTRPSCAKGSGQLLNSPILLPVAVCIEMLMNCVFRVVHRPLLVPSERSLAVPAGMQYATPKSNHSGVWLTRLDWRCVCCETGITLATRPREVERDTAGTITKSTVFPPGETGSPWFVPKQLPCSGGLSHSLSRRAHSCLAVLFVSIRYPYERFRPQLPRPCFDFSCSEPVPRGSRGVGAALHRCRLLLPRGQLRFRPGERLVRMPQALSWPCS
jgi:hypothetical protein